MFEAALSEADCVWSFSTFGSHVVRGRMGTDRLTREVADIGTSQTKARIIVAFAGKQVTGRIRTAPLDHKVDVSEPVQRRK